MLPDAKLCAAAFDGTVALAEPFLLLLAGAAAEAAAEAGTTAVSSAIVLDDAVTFLVLVSFLIALIATGTGAGAVAGSDRDFCFREWGWEFRPLGFTYIIPVTEDRGDEATDDGGEGALALLPLPLLPALLSLLLMFAPPRPAVFMTKFSAPFGSAEKCTPICGTPPSFRRARPCCVMYEANPSANA